jgi:hypothetical protein
MNRSTLRAVILLFLALSLAGTLPAQNQTASLRGRIMDSAGKPLAGVAVLILSPSFQGQADALTESSGAFDFLALPPGIYELRADLPGHRSFVRRNILLQAGRTVELKIALESSEVEDDAIIATPLTGIDVFSVRSGVVLSSTLLEALPLHRDLRDIQAMAPGAVGEGRPYDRAVSIQGGSARGQNYLLDGAGSTDPSSGFPIGNLSVDILDQVEIISTGKPAAEESGRGAAIHLLSKSGGNAFAGSLGFYLSGDALSSDAFDAAAVKGLALAPSDKYLSLKDFSLNLGGPLWEDRAWYFLSMRRAFATQPNPYSPGSRLAGLSVGDASSFDRDQSEWMFFLKATVNATEKIRYTGSFHWTNLYQPVDEASLAPNTAFDATWILDHENSYATSHLVTFDLSPKVRVEVRGTYIERDVPKLSRDSLEYTSVDFSRQVTWGAAPYNIKSAFKRMSGQASITAFLDRFLGADHVFKAGGGIEQSDSTRDWWRSNPYYSLWYDWAADNPYYVDPLNKIGLLRMTAAPGAEAYWHPQDTFRRFSAFMEDGIKTGRLALNLGLRLDYSLEFVPAQSRPALSFNYAPELIAVDLGDNDLLAALIQRFTDAGLKSPFDLVTIPYKKVVDYLTLAPRAGLSYDLFGDGSTALKLSFARDYESLWTGLYGSGHLFDPQVVEWNWYDLNGDKHMDLPGTDEYVLTSAVTQDTALNPFKFIDASGVEHTVKPPRLDTFTAALEREVMTDLTIGAQFTLRNSSNLISLIDTENGYDPTARDEKGLIWLPMTVTDPGRDAVLGTSDDKSLTVYGLRADRPTPVYRYANIPEAEQKYMAGILTFDKRLSHGWQLAGSLVLSSFKGNLGADAAAGYASTSRFTDPNGLTNASGPLWLDRPFQAKIMAGVQLPYEFFLGAYFRFLSGAPYGRSLARVYFPDGYMGYGTQTPYVTVSAEASGVGREPAFSSLDLRLQRGFRIGRAGKLDLYLDVFNLFGSSALFEDNDPAGVLRSDLSTPTYAVSSTYGSILSYYGVRSIRLGAKINF